jgi:hypothetical protein
LAVEACEGGTAGGGVVGGTAEAERVAAQAWKAVQGREVALAAALQAHAAPRSPAEAEEFEKGMVEAGRIAARQGAGVRYLDVDSLLSPEGASPAFLLGRDVGLAQAILAAVVDRHLTGLLPFFDQ